MRAKSSFRSIIPTGIMSAVPGILAFFFVFNYIPLGMDKALPFLLSLETAFIVSAALFLALLRKNMRRGISRSERELINQSEQRLRMFEELSDNLHFDADLNEDRIVFSSSFESVLGQMPGINRLSDWRSLLSFLVLEDLQSAMDAWRRVLDRAQQASTEVRIVDAEGRAVWHRLSLAAQYNADGEAYRILGRLSNIDESMRKTRRIQLSGMRDPLTRLNSRASTQELIDDFLDNEGRSGRHVMILVGIDNYKFIKDSSGRAAGERALISLAKSIRVLFRSTDIIGRLSGNEIVILIKDVSKDYRLEARVNEIKAAAANLKYDVQSSFPITCSIGTSIYRYDGEQFEDLCGAAEASAYKSGIGTGFALYPIPEQQTMCDAY